MFFFYEIFAECLKKMGEENVATKIFMQWSYACFTVRWPDVVLIIHKFISCYVEMENSWTHLCGMLWDVNQVFLCIASLPVYYLVYIHRQEEQKEFMALAAH